MTGGCGYIGSHTITDLVQQGHEVISIDNLSRSKPASLKGIEAITGTKVRNYPVDLCNIDETIAVFNDNPDITGIIHFAAYKEVGESEENPLLYYSNNLNSLINILHCAAEFEVPHFIFSAHVRCMAILMNPVLQKKRPKNLRFCLWQHQTNGRSDCQQAVKRYPFLQAVLLRYFNPVGAHPSLELGELPKGRPANLVPGNYTNSYRETAGYGCTWQ